MPWLLNPMGTPVNFEILSHHTSELIWNLIIMCWFTLHWIELVKSQLIICEWLDFEIPIHFEDEVYPFKLANEWESWLFVIL